MKISFTVFSSLGKKIFMGLTGLMLCGFIVIHLIGNLALLSPNPDPFNKYAHFLTQQTGNIIYVAEAMLAAVFLIHFFYAIYVTWNNWTARPSGYKVVKGAGHTSRKSIGSTTMIYTGILVMVFLVMHLLHFKYAEAQMYVPAGYEYQIKNLYAVVHNFFSNIGNVSFYVVIMGLLGFHLSHGFWSAFQSLGLSGSRFTPVVYTLGSIYAVVMAIGFILFPVISFIKGGGL